MSALTVATVRTAFPERLALFRPRPVIEGRGCQVAWMDPVGGAEVEIGLAII